MKLAVMQPYTFPYIGYFQLINAVDKIVFYDDVTFIKQGWINRNNILMNGEKYLFSFPVKKISSFASIKETYVSDRPFNWPNKLVKTFRHAYGKAPFYKDVFPIVEEIILESSDHSIAQAAKNSILRVMQYLEMTTPIVLSSSIYNNLHLRSEERVIDICKLEHADVYINASGGRDLYQPNHFEAAGIKLFFIETFAEPYKQFGKEFVPGLSIIDVIMFNSGQEVRKMLLNCGVGF